MRIQDIEKGKEITIEICLRGEKIEFQSHIMEQIKNAALIDPIRVDGKFLNLSGKGVKITIFYQPEEAAPVMWEYVPMQSVLYKGNACYKCILQAQGVSANRRDAYRLFIGQDAVAQVGANHKGINILLNEISESGFSFLYAGELSVEIGTPVHVVFDMDKMHFNLQGELVRTQELEDGKVIYGCRLTIKNYNISKYIALKQREKMVLGKKEQDKIREATISQLGEAFKNTSP